MNNRQVDRHKTPRHYQAGSDKRKNAKEKQKRESEILSQTHRLTDFVIKRPTTSTALQNPDEIKIAENDAAINDPTILDGPVKKDHSNIDRDDVVNDTISEEVNRLQTEDEIFSDCDIGSNKVQNCDAELFKRESVKQYDKNFTRTCQMSMFERKHKNGETIKREWLCFSPSNGKLYCFFCKLLNTVETQFSHESGRIDFELIQQLDDEINYWRNVLKRVASVILFVSERGLPFRGDNEIIGSAHNGNYLGLLELLAEYDDFLEGHIGNHANPGRGHVNYLSSTICNEFRQLIARRVFDEIIRRIKHSQYYSFTLDSTKDEGHIDQLVLIFRYIEENGGPVERFLTFMPNQGHKAKIFIDRTILSTEYDLMKALDISDIIDDFAKKNARKFIITFAIKNYILMMVFTSLTGPPPPVRLQAPTPFNPALIMMLITIIIVNSIMIMKM
ncbi:uncharacterized protein LOC124413609 [Diprion similis]|uniref:uncharacterized protein LOC124413609 n=1 Tax=Diprion similis TaxID=362088 RepID=UPI001EF9B627|nr:uncharacterized protein LOC124413609 [Diprion similis]